MVVVAAIDQSEDAQQIIDQAQTLASDMGEEIHVVHALDSTEFAELQREHVSSTPSDEGVLVREQIAAELADGVVSELDETTEIVGLKGEPADSIAEYAERNDAKYIAIGGRQRSPTGKALFGNTTQSVLLQADRPIVVVPLGE